MEFKELVLRNRSYRRFDESKRVDMSTLEELVELGRNTPSAGNLQPLKYVLVSDPDACADVFGTLGWAGYLPEWAGPSEGERPTGYVVVLHDTSVAESPNCDHGIVSQTIMLGAVEKGFGGCILASVNRKKLADILGIAEPYEILLVLALGAPVETCVLEDISGDAEDAATAHKYYREADGTHHVPKRALADIIVEKR